MMVKTLMVVCVLVLSMVGLAPVHAVRPELVASGATGTAQPSAASLSGGQFPGHCATNSVTIGCVIVDVFNISLNFQAYTTMTLDHIVMELTTSGAMPSGTLVPALFPTSGGNPTGTTPLQTGTAVNINSISGMAAYTFTFSSGGVALSQGVTYAVGIESLNTTNWGANNIHSLGDVNGPGGEQFYGRSGPAWNVVTSYTPFFQVWADPPSVSQQLNQTAYYIAGGLVVTASLFGALFVKESFDNPHRLPEKAKGIIVVVTMLLISAAVVFAVGVVING